MGDCLNAISQSMRQPARAVWGPNICFRILMALCAMDNSSDYTARASGRLNFLLMPSSRLSSSPSKFQFQYFPTWPNEGGALWCLRDFEWAHTTPQFNLLLRFVPSFAIQLFVTSWANSRNDFSIPLRCSRLPLGQCSRRWFLLWCNTPLAWTSPSGGPPVIRSWTHFFLELCEVNQEFHEAQMQVP